MKKPADLLAIVILAGAVLAVNSCKKEPGIPVLTTEPVTEITANTAVSGGNVISDEGAEVTARGVCFGTSANPALTGLHTSDGTGPGGFVSLLSGLETGKVYYVRAYAISKNGTTYGNELTFTTLQILPVVTTNEIFNIGQTEAVIRSGVDANGGSGILSKGVCWGTESNPSIDSWHTENGSGEGSFDSYLTGLLPGTDYFARAYATTATGTAYGNELAFKTADGLSPINFNPGIDYGSVMDVDGNIYKTVKIGDQTWMAENLKTTKYNDGGSIPFVDNAQDWSALSTPAYAWYADSPAVYKDICGAMYNWYTISTGKLCPAGWHVPAYGEYTDLIAFLDGGTNTGGKMKETGTSHWEEPNAGATNESGWTGIPSGRINETGSTMSYGWAGYWWTSTETDPDRANNIMLYFDFVFVDDNNYDKRNGMAVRCVQD